jgi:hypothetical protein
LSLDKTNTKCRTSSVRRRCGAIPGHSHHDLLQREGEKGGNFIRFYQSVFIPFSTIIFDLDASF